MDIQHIVLTLVGKRARKFWRLGCGFLLHGIGTSPSIRLPTKLASALVTVAICMGYCNYQMATCGILVSSFHVDFAHEKTAQLQAPAT
jgi:hypothetical protein